MTTPSPRSTSSQASTTHKYAITSRDLQKLSSSWLRVLKNEAMGMRKRNEIISVSIPKSVFLNDHAPNVTLDYEDLLDWSFQKEIGASQVSIFMK